ncbi:MAG: hypothetical protein VKO39_13670 [Cyanobacteriota bacterium]|nr:hypothetical protein [Cyanobacteriota bacterium]
MGRTTAIELKLQGLAEINRLHRMTDPDLYRKADRVALNAASKTAVKQVAKDISSKYTIPSRRVKDSITGPYFQADGVTIRASRVPPTQNQYRFKPGKRGGPQPGMGRGMGWGKPNPAGRQATAQVFKGRPARRIKGAFLAKGLPFIRVRKGQGPGSLKVLKGPSIARIFNGRGLFGQELRNNAARAIQETYLKRYKKVLDDAARGY